MAKRRRLTAGEIALARAAFGDRIDYGKVRLSDGPGMQPLAHAAFASGNSAITVGSSVYFKTNYCSDFCAPGRKRKSFIHEMTHVWQYQTLGMPAFFARYGLELAKAGGNAGAMYLYEETDRFDQAMLEAQADMVGDYSDALWANDQQRMAKLARNLRGSGVYGL